MIVACSACGAKYRYDESRFEGKPLKRIRCTKCQTVFDVQNPSLAPQAQARPETPVANPSPVVPGAPSGSPSGDTTRMRRSSEDSPSETTKQFVFSKLKVTSLAQNLKLPAGKKLSLAVISGVDSGRNFPIEKARVVIGRSGADISLADTEISREHAALEIAEDLVTLLDLESTNGTFVAGNRVASAELENYGEFEVGGTTLMLIVTAETL
ncbi:MAG: FHA domain-containing protein [Thermoanaerobaculia bacterium]